MNDNKKPGEPLEPERWALKNASTEQLVTEPYQFKTVNAEGPALVFVVTD